MKMIQPVQLGRLKVEEAAASFNNAVSPCHRREGIKMKERKEINKEKIKKM